jgi:hypothetical protein
MAEKRNGAGSRLSGLLERSTPPEPPVEVDDTEGADVAIGSDVGSPVSTKGRGAAAKKTKPSEGRPAKIKGRTVYLHDDLFERIIVQAHRRGRTISEYVSAILERQVPDHRVVRSDQGESDRAG